MQSATRIAKSVDALLSHSDSSSIPLALYASPPKSQHRSDADSNSGAWITFPIVLKLTLLGNIRTPGDSAAELQDMRSLMRILYVLKSRFSGGQFVSNLIDAVMKRVIHGGVQVDQRMHLALLHDAAKYIQEDVDREIVTGG
jgi:hypothetical protein